MSTVEVLKFNGDGVRLRTRFARATLWALAGAAASRSLNMAAWVVCARLLGRVQFGGLTMVQSTAGVFGVVAGLGVGLTATKYVAEHRDSDPARAGRVLSLSLLVAAVSGLLISIALWASAGFLATRTLAAPELRTPLALGAGLVLFGALNGFETGALAGFEAFSSIALVNLWAGLLSFAAITAGAYWGGINGAVAGLAAGLCINFVLNHAALLRACRRAGVPWSLDNCFQELHVLYHFSMPALLASMLVTPAAWLCNAWLIRQPGGLGDLGLYGAADRWRLAILFIPASLVGPVLSMLVNLRGSGNLTSYRKVFRSNLLLNILMVAVPTVAIVCFAPAFMRIFGSGYHEGRGVLVVLAISAIPEALNMFLGQPLIDRSMWQRCAFDALMVATLLTGAWFLIPIWRGVGLAAAYAIAFTVTSTALLIFQRKQLFGS
jgi:O-antigen/teichoic acid export membrane protein